MIIDDNPLVSVVVITYKSANTILETLESFKQQTYKNIELIVSDDCSPDNTVEVVEEWIKNNSSYFVKVQLLKNSQNIGPSGNLNRGIKAATGEWIKSLAGDDTVTPDAIAKYVEYVINHPGFPVVTAKMKAFKANGNSCDEDQNGLERQYALLRTGNREKQYHNALKGHILAGPGLFKNKKFCEEIGGYNEKYPMGEEYDFELRVFERVYVPIIEEYLVNWRISPSSLSHKMSLKSVQSDYLFFKEVKSKLLLKEKMYLSYYQEKLDFLIALHPRYHLILKYLKLLKPAFWHRILFKIFRNG